MAFLGQQQMTMEGVTVGLVVGNLDVNFKASVFTGAFMRPHIQYTAGIVGFHSGDSGHDFELPFSGTANVSDLSRNSNIGVKGVYVYRIDQSRIEGIS